MKKLGKYQIIERIGRGGFATVYRARDTRMGRDVALKVIHNAPDEAAFVQRFEQEARTAADLRHPNIVPVYDFGDAESTLYLAMALIGDGHTLRDLLAGESPLSLERTLSILVPLADALDYLHGRSPPLTHRDVKPGNVLLEREGDSLWVVLTDFGLVRSMETSTELTKTGAVLGTPAYMAPEQADPKQWGGITPLTDVYALGVITYQMLTGRVPFEGEMVTVLHAHAYEDPPSPLEFVPDLGDDLNGVLLRALAKPSPERYPSAGAFVTALQEVAGARTKAVEQEATLEQLEAQARELLDAGEWLKALDCCTQMMQIDPDRSAALEMLTVAKRGLDRERTEAVKHRHVEEWYAEGLQLLNGGRWKQAIASLAKVAEVNPDFLDVREKLAQARDEHQRALWYDEAIAHGETRRWAEACRAWVRVLRGGWDYRDGDAAARFLNATDRLLSQLETVKELFKRQQRVLEEAHETLMLYDSLAVTVEAGEWERAAEVGERLVRLSPGLDRPQVWLAHAHSELERKAALGDDLRIWERDGKEMVRIPAGAFLYGDKHRRLELPEFWMDEAPVTNAEYARFVTAVGRKPPEHWQGETPPEQIANHPVTHVSWHDAIAYAEWAGKRLPTEEEWEKAARGTDGRDYPWGYENPTPELCNFGLNERATTPVGKYSPQGDSPYGCVDMAGNVWEWTANDHENGGKVLRGGSWYHFQTYVRTDYRLNRTPAYRTYDIGFRCVSLSGDSTAEER
ncbi:MAG: SUMF1/EgtB/PvdO family nonheme iron enzyme [Chloroflexota bacterium]|nr:SUMF1/EgtB/PvdO family nonheme iron enzyme [Chloroflexota bacterium]